MAIPVLILDQTVAAEGYQFFVTVTVEPEPSRSATS